MRFSVNNSLAARILAVVLAYVLCSHLAWASFDTGTMFCRELGQPEGLSSDKVTSLEEDEMGRIWIGTHKGVNYYDSQKIVTLPFFKSSRITALFSLPGKMIVCSVSGMVEYSIKTGQWHPITFEENEINNVEGGVVIDDELVLLTEYGIVSYDGSKCKRVSDNGFGIRRIVRDRYGVIWGASHHRVVSRDVNNDAEMVYEVAGLGANQSISGLFCESTGTVWGWSSGGKLFRYSRTSDSFVNENLIDADGHIIFTDNISCIIESEKGQLLIGYHDGIVIYDSRDRIASRLGYSNSSFDRLQTVTAIACSKYGGLFAGSFFNGVFEISPDAYDVHLIDLSHSFGGSVRTSTVANNMYECEDGSLIVGTNNNSLVCLDKDGGNLHRYIAQGMKAPEDVLTIEDDDSGYLWAGLQYSGLVRVDKSGKVSQVVPQAGKFSGACISDLFSVCKDRLYVATENGIDMLCPSKMEVKQLIKGKEECLYFGVFPVADKVVFVNHSSLFVLNRKGSALKEIPYESTSGATFRCGRNGSDGLLYLGTDNGQIVVFDISDDSFRVLNETSLQGAEISNLLFDKSERLWATSGRKLFVFNGSGDCLQDYDLVGLMGRRLFNIRSSLLCRDGEAIFGTTDGIIRFSPDELMAANQNARSIHISQIVANGKSLAELLDRGHATIAKDGEIVLRHHFSTITVGCTVIDYSPFKTGSNHVQVKVDKVSKGWETAPDDLVVSSSPLRPGKYVIDWRLCSASGEVLSTDTASVRIKPHWLASPLMQMMYFILGLTLVYLALQFVEKERTRKFEKIRMEENRRINELFNARVMELMVNMGNDFKAPLSIVYSALSANDMSSIDLVRTNVDKMRYLVDQMLDIEKIGLASSVGLSKRYDFAQFLKIVCDKLIPKLEKDKIRLTLEGGDKEMPLMFDPGKMELIVCNLFKHVSKLAQFDSSATMTVNEENGRVVARINFLKRPEVDPKTELGQHIAHCLCDLSGYHLEEEVADEALRLTLELPSEVGGTVDSLASYGFEITDRFADSVVDEGFSPSEFRDSEGHRKYSLLVVDENGDHVELIKRSLKHDLHVRSAKSGVEAVQMLAAGDYDIVLSEIELPDMSGYDLCRTIKSADYSRNTPVILESYGMTERKRLMALTAGADQTIEKPVPLPSLFLMIRNLLQSNDAMRNKLMAAQGIDISNQKISSSDDRMLEKAIAYIKENISTSISITNLSEALGVSRSRLYDDFNRITGMTPGEFVLKIKMQEACLLLDSTNLTASEISYKLGYCNPNHFTRQFKSVNGMTPISWRNKK